MHLLARCLLALLLLARERTAEAETLARTGDPRQRASLDVGDLEQPVGDRTLGGLARTLSDDRGQLARSVAVGRAESEEWGLTNTEFIEADASKLARIAPSESPPSTG